MSPPGEVAALGTAICWTCSSLAFEQAEAGIAAAIIATTPVWLIAVALLRGECVHLGGILGALAAVAGVALLVTR